MAKKSISPEEKEFIREVFEWIQTTAVERGHIPKDWKSYLVEYITSEMRKEGKEVKEASVRRNLNRMIAYYYDTGSQARSGAKYLSYIKNLVNNIKNTYSVAGGMPAQYFISAKEARMYAGEILALHPVPDFDTKMIQVIRFYTEPKF